jgi:hypothetical protein
MDRIKQPITNHVFFVGKWGGKHGMRKFIIGVVCLLMLSTSILSDTIRTLGDIGLSVSAGWQDETFFPQNETGIPAKDYENKEVNSVSINAFDQIVQGVANNGVYANSVTIFINSGFAFLNGQAFTSGATIYSIGKHQLDVYDDSGFVSSITFEIFDVWKFNKFFLLSTDYQDLLDFDLIVNSTINKDIYVPAGTKLHILSSLVTGNIYSYGTVYIRDSTITGKIYGNTFSYSNTHDLDEIAQVDGKVYVRNSSTNNVTTSLYSLSPILLSQTGYSINADGNWNAVVFGTTIPKMKHVYYVNKLGQNIKVDLNADGTFIFRENVKDMTDMVIKIYPYNDYNYWYWRFSIINNEVPTITLNGDANTYIERGDSYIELGAICVDKSGASIQCIIDSSEVNTSKMGEYTVQYDAVDSNGYEAVRVFRKVIVIDTVAPIITIEPYSTVVTNQNVEIFASTNEGTLNATSHTFTENGSFTFIATDFAGNKTEKTVTISHIDKNPPDVIGVEINKHYNTDRSITFIEGIATLNGFSFLSGGIISDEGEYTLIVTDDLGNSNTIFFIIDKTAPVIMVTPYSTETTHLPVTISVSTDEGTLNASGHTFTENGSFTFIAIDLAGNVTEKTVTITHLVNPSQVKTIVISQLPTKLQYIQGVDIDPTSGQITAFTYDGNSFTVPLSPDMLSGYDPNSSIFGPQTVTITYQGVTTTFDVFLNRFIDVPYGHRNYVHINTLVGLGIINGYNDNTFRPNNTLTRAQAAIMIVRAAGISTEGVSSNFTDVPPTHAAYKFISAAFQAGIINGYSDGTFKPNANVTRAQIAIMVQRAFNIQASGTLVNFTDVPEGYAPKKFIEILASQKIVNGYSDGTFKPLNNVTRAQFSTMIFNAIQYAQKAE